MITDAIKNLFLLLLIVLLIGLPAIGFTQSTVCGYVFLDQNQNNVKDTHEPVRAHHAIYLLDWTLISRGQGGSFSMVTDAQGSYCFLADSIGSYAIFTDIPEDMKLLTPIQAEGAMPPYPLQVTTSNQKLSVNFGFSGKINEPVWGHCQNEKKDESVCVHNDAFLMQVTPHAAATHIKSMTVYQKENVYLGSNEAADVVVGEYVAGTRSASNKGNSEVQEVFSITVGKHLTDTGEEVALDVFLNRDGSYDFLEPTHPNVIATLDQEGVYTVADAELPTVKAVFDLENNLTVTDEADPTQLLFVEGATGIMTVVDSEYPSTVAVVNPDGSYTITDTEFPDLVATVYADQEYVVKDIKNNQVVHIDAEGNYTVIDNEKGICVVLPNTRGFLSNLWKGIKKVVNKVTRFVSKVAGFVGKVAKFVAKVAPIVSKALRIFATVTRVAALLIAPVFPVVCQFLCTVAAFAEKIADLSDKVGFFAGKVADIAEKIEKGSRMAAIWVTHFSEGENTNSVGKQTLNKVEQCFGAVGNQCDGVPLPAFLDHNIDFKRKENLDGSITVGVTVGSILHDICCVRHPNGKACTGWKSPLDDLPNAHDGHCIAEWDKAWYNTMMGRGWNHTFGPYQPGQGDDFTQPALLKAPGGTRLDVGDQAYCASGKFRETKVDLGWIALCEGSKIGGSLIISTLSPPWNLLSQSVANLMLYQICDRFPNKKEYGICAP